MSYIRMHLEWRKDGKHSSIRASKRSPHASDKEWGEWCQSLYQDVMSSLQPNEVPVPSSFPSRANKDESPAEPAAPMPEAEDSAEPQREDPLEALMSSWQQLSIEGCDLNEIFSKLDLDKNGRVSKDELREIFIQLHIPVENVDIDKVFHALDANQDNSIDIDDIRQIIFRRIDLQVIEDLANNLDWAKLFARKFISQTKQGKRRASLSGAIERTLSNRSLIQNLLDDVKKEVAVQLEQKLNEKLSSNKTRSMAPQSSFKDKFSMSSSHLRNAGFGSLRWFRRGLDGTIGLPAINVKEAMELEHSSLETFITGNYQLRTCPAEEWEFVVSPSEARKYPGEESEEDPGGRKRCLLSELMQSPLVAASGLTEEELIALRLYTGPMYMLYNEVLRGALHRKKQKGQFSYVTTIHMINSGILKLASASPLPPGRKVYRGLSGMRLPECFFVDDASGCRGGVELAFMSTTVNFDVALQYTGSRDSLLPIIFEISMGQVDRGASLHWLSQYPEENEVLLPPLSNLEVIGSPKAEVFGERNVLVFSMRLNVNLKSMNKEELEGRRKALHMNALNNTMQEIERDLFQRVAMLPKGDAGTVRGEGRRVVERILEECNRFVELYESQDVRWYNKDMHYKHALEESSNLRSLSLELFSYWEENTEVADYNIDALSMIQVHRLKSSFLLQCYREAETEEERKQAALKIVIWEGLVESEEKIDTKRGFDGDTALITAVAQGNVDQTILLLDASCSIHAQNRKGFTALATASLNGHLDCVRILLERKADVAKMNDRSEPPLFLACRSGHVECVKLLIEYGARVQTRAMEGNSSVFVAAEQGHLDVLQEIVNVAGTKILLQRNAKGWTCLHLAAQQGHLEVVRFLVEQGGHRLFRSKDGTGRTCLHWASKFSRKSSQKSVLQLLRELPELRLEDPDNQSRNCMHLAARYGCEENLEYICREGGASLLTEDIYGFSPLHLACLSGVRECVKLLCEIGGTELLWRKSRQGTIAFHFSCANGRRKITEDLLNLGGNELINARSSDGRTPIFYAAMNGHTREVELLCNVGGAAILEAKDDEGWNVLHWLTEGKMGEAEAEDWNTRVNLANKKECASFLCRASPALLWEREPLEGRTCMHLACASGHLDMVALLFAEAGRPMLLERDIKGRTCLHSAAWEDKLEVIRYLWDIGGEDLLFLTDETGMTCAHYAVLNSRRNSDETDELEAETDGLEGNHAENDEAGQASSEDEEEKDKRAEEGFSLLDATMSVSLQSSMIHAAAETEVLRFLLSVGKRKLLEMKDNEGNTVLDIAIANDLGDCQDIIEKAFKRNT
ncbi:hypothetical protein GUITHDRAFT_107067 [Guillardia theta CCMP2712]|uniref:NAD(P)(+)--arginine ADP-ribosyltransferase n=1 Tax=Guillardia theta (strain CCMP2712) TaxID=905079 RepID=L1JF75_GUITC|nr:hypothetical protein GUITHDRAFT_107067 [Guillardia theta CCMP2712]EKX47156.1 hypothetical protein GUITHDRAFT_107067 [Guillardia theta CCMP2712]|eukprot:XP_005834136.1 hypothetical protein GUITHDRAFT_107067 [Guillardia theta CCMP2712]